LNLAGLALDSGVQQPIPPLKEVQMTSATRLLLLSGAAILVCQATVLASPPKKAPLRPATVQPSARIQVAPAAGVAAKPVRSQNATRHAGQTMPDKLLGGPALSDLRPAPYFGAGGLPEGYPQILYCDNDPQQGGASNKVRFRVRNLGASGAAASTVSIQFGNGVVAQQNAPAIPSGQEVSGAFDIPAGCYQPPGFSGSCQFTLTVDSSGVIAESIESNNSTSSFCVAPAG